MRHNAQLMAARSRYEQGGGRVKKERIKVKPHHSETDKIHLICFYSPSWARSYSVNESDGLMTVTFFETRATGARAIRA